MLDIVISVEGRILKVYDEITWNGGGSWFNNRKKNKITSWGIQKFEEVGDWCSKGSELYQFII